MINYLHEISRELDVDRVFNSIECKIDTKQKRLFRPAQMIIECTNTLLDKLYMSYENALNLETKTDIKGHISDTIDSCELSAVHTSCMDKLYKLETKYGLVFDSIVTYRTNYTLYISICVKEKT